jgi:hypothetical protein
MALPSKDSLFFVVHKNVVLSVRKKTEKHCTAPVTGTLTGGHR